MLEKHLKYGKLYDYYGEILKEKHNKVIKQYYLQDLSLKEISENLDITRQGVYDLLKRAEKNLDEIDNKLNIIEKQEKYKNDMILIIENMREEITNNNTKKINEKIKELIDLIKEI